MSKDPAFLFYPGDWLGGTMIMSRHQKGCYIDLLITQFNNGPLSLETIKTVLGQDQAIWTVLSSKFKQDSSGNFFNERLATEIEKRKKFCRSRGDNRKGGKNQSYESSHENHMNHHMENEDENRNENRSKDENKDFGKSENLLVPRMSSAFKKTFPTYLPDKERDYKPLYSIATFLCQQANVNGPPEIHVEQVLEAWESICTYLVTDKFYSQKSLSTISNHIQEITQKAIHGDKSTAKKTAKLNEDTLKQKLAERFGKTG